MLAIAWATLLPCNCNFQTDEQDVITFLLNTEIIPLCLRIMESGSELSKTVRKEQSSLILQWLRMNRSKSTLVPNYDRENMVDCSWKHYDCINVQVATFILQKILLEDTGLAHICQTYERFSHVATVLVLWKTMLIVSSTRNTLFNSCMFFS